MHLLDFCFVNTRVVQRMAQGPPMPITSSPLATLLLRRHKKRTNRNIFHLYPGKNLSSTVQIEISSAQGINFKMLLFDRFSTLNGDGWLSFPDHGPWSMVRTYNKNVLFSTLNGDGWVAARGWPGVHYPCWQVVLTLMGRALLLR